jgi:hypothetical protein
MVVAALAGLTAGFFHALSGPDHLAAVAPLAVGRDRGAWRSGFTWGAGHTAGMLAVGALLLVFRGLLPIDALSAWSERAVGLALVAVGIWGVWKARQAHAHHHAAAGASFGMGTLHGLAGSSHLFGVLPTLAFASTADAAWYLGGFGVGAIVAMTGFAAVFGLVAPGSAPASLAVRRGLLYASSLAAVVIGGAWLLA